MLRKPFHEEINHAKRPCRPHKTASRATGWAALHYSTNDNVTPVKRIREQKVSTHLLIYTFSFFKLSLGFGLDFEFGLGINPLSTEFFFFCRK